MQDRTEYQARCSNMAKLIYYMLSEIHLMYASFVASIY